MIIEQYGRLCFWVRSRTRKRKRHYVDLEGFEQFPCCCQCEAWKYRVSFPVCAHVRACIEHVLEPAAIAADFTDEEMEDCVDACVFSLQIDQSIPEALLGFLNRRKARFEQIEETRKQRRYTLDQTKKYAPPKSANQKRKWGLPAGMSRESSRISNSPRPSLLGHGRKSRRVG